MPGHKGGYNLDECFLKGVMPFDFTELSKTDNLFNPIEIINEAQQNAADMLEVKSVYYLTGGATLGIYASLCICKRFGSKVIVDRGCHKSVLDALICLI
jgi:arginine/lysine/ornithine decarboxylase